MPSADTRRSRRRRWVVALCLPLALAAVAVVIASRGVYDAVPFPARAASSPPAWTAPCARAVPEYEHEPQCARVRGRVVWRELHDADGDGDRHLVVISRLRLRVVKLMRARRYGGSVPGIGDVIEAVGFTGVGARGEREIYTESLRR